MGAVARIPKHLLVERLRHGIADVDPDQVHQLERTHLETAEPHDAVDGRHVGKTFAQNPERLQREGSGHPIDHEGRRVGNHNRCLPESAGQRHRCVNTLQCTLLGPDHLDQCHHGWRVEEVHPDHALRLVAAAIAVMLSEEVLLARSAVGAQI